MKFSYQKGFSLTELAIVLVILGVILSGVLVGRNVLEASRGSSVIEEVTSYQEAIAFFKDKYNALPGDMNDATDVLDGAVDEGDGDGDIEYDDNEENALAWHHLEIEGLIDAGGLTGTDGTGAVLGVNVPASSYPSAGYHFDHDDIFSKEGYNIFNTYIGFGAQDATDDGRNDAPIIPPKVASQIDNKMDDNVADSGRVHGYDGAIDTSGTCASSGSYNLNRTDKVCTLFFKLEAQL